MLYYLFEYLSKHTSIPGTGLFTFLSFRAALAAGTSLLIAIVFGKKIIKFIQRKQIGEDIRDLGLEGQVSKKGTPTMGGVIIILATIIPTLLFCKLHNIYVILLIISTIWIGTIGFLDDYIKVFKKNKEGLQGKFKIIGQIGLGIIVGTILFVNDGVKIKEFQSESIVNLKTGEIPKGVEMKSLKTNVPFFKDNHLDYSDFITWIDEDLEDYAWLIFIPIVIFIITAVSNGVNLTDGLDGLAAGTSVISLGVLGLLVWLSGNFIFANYLGILYIPNAGEMTIFIAALIGGLIGFLWYNSFPAQVFMGDTGSLTLGGLIAVIAIASRKELLLPLLGGVFFIESLSVIIQVAYFKYTKKKFGEGRRIFLMSPLHHHYQKKGWHEVKIVNRLWIVAILLGVLTIALLKVR